MLRVLLADDHPLFLDSVANFLSCHPRVEIVGRAGSGDEAVALCRKTTPHLVLMDLAMPRMNGVEATRQIKAGPDFPLVIALTFHDSPAWREAAQGAGVDGFISKREFVQLLPRVLAQLIPSNSFDSSFFERTQSDGETNRKLEAAPGNPAQSANANQIGNHEKSPF